MKLMMFQKGGGAALGLVEGKTVQIRYDTECEDRFDRTLAYVSVAGQEVNKLMLERGYACLLHIPPNGDDVADEYKAIETATPCVRPAGKTPNCRN